MLSSSLYARRNEKFSIYFPQCAFPFPQFMPRVHVCSPQVMVTDWNRSVQAMETDTLMNYIQLTGNLSASVEDMESFKLVALVTLLNGAAASEEDSLARLAKKYDTILQRRADTAPAVGSGAGASALVEAGGEEDGAAAGEKRRRRQRGGVGGSGGPEGTGVRASYARIRHGMSSVEELAAIFEKLQAF